MTNKVYLAVGHGVQPNGVEDPGAVGNGWSEQTAGDRVVAKAADLLRAAGIEVISEAYKRDPNFVGSTSAANAAKVNCLVTVHHDSRTAPEGSFAYHWPSSSQGKRLAELIINQIKSRGLPTRNAWLGPGKGTANSPVAGRGLYILEKTNMPAVLLEVGPIGHHTLDTDEELHIIGHEVAEGVAAWFGVSLTPEKPKIVRAVAVSAVREPDVEWARMLAHAHMFAFVLKNEGKEGWTQFYPDGKTAHVDEIEYLVGVGGPSEALVHTVGRGVLLAGRVGNGTRMITIEKIKDQNVPRREPWKV